MEVPLLDANGGLRVNVVGGTNPAASATGVVVPAAASYVGLDISGNLVGQTGLSLTNAKAAAVAIVDSSGTQIGNADGSLNVSVTKTVNACASASGTGVTVPLDADYIGFDVAGNLTGVSSTNPLPVALNSGSTSLTNTGGSLNVNVTNTSSGSNAAASATGSAIPADASYTGFNSGGSLVGVSVATPLPVTAEGLVDVQGYVTTSAPSLTSSTYSPLSLNPSGGLRVDASGTNLTANIMAGGNPLTNSSGSLNVEVTGANTLPTNAVLCIGETYNPVSGSLSVPVSANTTPQSATNPMFSRITDGTEAIQTAISALGTAPIGNYVMAVNNVNLPSAAAGAALSSMFINNTGAAVSVKSSAGNLYGFSLTNNTASPVFVEFFNPYGSAGVPTLGSTAVEFCVMIPASGNVTLPPNMPLANFSTGLGFAATTTENGTTTAAVTGMIFYK